jgi:hypothetical protein
VFAVNVSMPAFCFSAKTAVDKLLDEGINIKFLMKLERNMTDIYKILQQVFGERTVSRTQGFV